MSKPETEVFVFENSTPELEAYLSLYNDKEAQKDFKTWRARLEEIKSTITPDLLDIYHKARKKWLVRDATAKSTETVSSETNKYQLHISYHSTGPGTWNYTKGKVYHEDKLIAEVPHNYSSFPFLFIEDHPNGNDYLICHEDYQGQVVIELNTGRKKVFLPESAKDGAGFCWVQYRFDAPSQLLTVAGCHWACPYEFRFYDFSDPMEKGWPQLEIDDETGYIDDDEQWPFINGDIIKCYQSTRRDDDEDDNDDAESVTKNPPTIAATKTFKRDGLKLVLLEESVSEEEQIRRKKQEEDNAAYTAKIEKFTTSDPLYLAYKARISTDTWLNPEKYESRGIIYEGWCPSFDKKETRWCRRIHNRESSKGYTIDLEWGIETGPIKLVIFLDGNLLENKFFSEHTVESMHQAFDYAQKLLSRN